MTDSSRSLRQRPQFLWLAVIAIVLVAGGCGGSPDNPVSEATAGSSQVSTPERTTRPARVTDPDSYAAVGSRFPQWGFITPSSTWICVIATAPSAGDHAACASNPDEGPLPTPNVPLAQADGGGDGTQQSNVIFVGEGVDATFGFERESIWGGDRTPPVLPYGEVLHVGGFSCNAQESVVSCRQDDGGKGFSISTTGYRFEYTAA